MRSQDAFAVALLDAGAQVPDGVVAPDGRSDARRFGVYRNNVVVSLTEALGQAFPAVRRIVGDAFFDAMAGVFVRAHPPASPLLFLYGEALPGFLEGFGPAGSVPYLADVARLEQARREAFHAADADPWDGAALRGLGPEALLAQRLRLHPSVRLVRSPHPVAAIWRHAMGGAGALPRGGQEVLVVRPEWEVEMHVLPSGGIAFLRALGSGRTLGEALDSVPEGDVAALVGVLFEARILLAPEGGVEGGVE